MLRTRQTTASPLPRHAENRQRAIEMREAGFTNAEIARKLGISAGGVTRLFQRVEKGVIRQAIARPDTPAVQLMLEVMRSREWTQAELADALGVARGSVEHWLGGQRNPRPEMIEKLKGLKGLD